ncbi:MAG: DUF5916 domain-containing protein [Myxococcota bacterium]
MLFALAVLALPPIPELRAHPRGDQEIVIDGVLDEPVWADAPVGAGFVERNPTREAVPPVDTRFRILFDRDALYVGLELDGAIGEIPRGYELRRDNVRIFSDDTVSLKFDVRRDKRSTLGFVVNASGARIDYVAVDGGSFRVEFDVVWDVAVARTDTGWVAEFRLPALALGLPDTDGEQVLGFNISRDHNARRATYDWSFLPPEFSPTFAPRYGIVRGIEGVRGGRVVSLIPFAISGYRRDDRSRFPADTPWTISGGGDVRFRVGEDSWVEATVLTDFAQVDLDDAVVNLDRFPLFFPEKRPFFLTGLDVFEFGDPGGVQQFFSRRIGLDENALEEPLFFGAKTYGRSGDLRFGVLNAVTGGDSTTNWGVARMRYNFRDTDYVGALLTSVYDFDAETSETGIGGDFILRADENRLQLTGFGTGLIDNEGQTSRDQSAGLLGLSYRGEYLRPFVRATWVGDDYDPQAGFVRRRGIFNPRTGLDLVVQSTPEAPLIWGLRQWRLSGNGGVFTDAAIERTLLREADTTFQLAWPGVSAGVAVGVERDIVDEAFELPANQDVTIAAGVYDRRAVELNFEASSQNNPFGELTVGYEDGFFGGTQARAEPEFGVALSKYFRATAGAFVARIDLPDSDPFTSTAANMTLSFTPNTVLLFDVTGQWNTQNDQVALLSRIRWRFLPGSDLFVVYRDRYGEDATGIFEEGQARSLIIKAALRSDVLL